MSSRDPSDITPEDIERAKIAWKNDAPPKMKNLLDAKPEGKVKNGRSVA